jgi:DnaJ family protein A protein 2
LFEALAGTKFDFFHLDGRPVQLSTPPGKILGNGESMCVEDLGMPFFGRSYKYGNLFINFTVIFPQSLTKAQSTAVRECLHTKEQTARHDPSIKPEHKLKQYQGTEQELLARLRKRCNNCFDYLK